jgi:large subunit ribosomal protein L22
MTQESNKNIAQAIGKSLKTSPQKANLVLSIIRKKKAEVALNLLTFSKKRISEQVSKILKSAISNAENNHQLDIDKLYVKEASVGKSMVMKRFRPRARGRSGKILKPFSRVRILVEEKQDKKSKQNVEPKTNNKPNEDNK